MDLSQNWKTIVDTLQDGVIVVDPRGTIVALNPAAEKLSGYTANELVGQSCRILDCTGCEIIGKGAGKQWCGLYKRGGVRAKKCTISPFAPNRLRWVPVAIMRALVSMVLPSSIFI